MQMLMLMLMPRLILLLMLKVFFSRLKITAHIWCVVIQSPNVAGNDTSVRPHLAKFGVWFLSGDQCISHKATWRTEKRALGCLLGICRGLNPTQLCGDYNRL